MARYGQVRPVNFFADFMAGKQAAEGEQAMRRQNALRDMQFQQAERANALGQNPNATPEDYIRAGDVQTGAALSDYQQSQRASQQQALGQVATVAQRALTITDPGQRKQFLAQATKYYGPAFSALGADPNKAPEMLAMPDADLEQMLQQVAQFAPRAAPLNVAAGGSLVDPSTGKPIYTAPTKPNEAPTSIQEYEYARSQGYKGSFQQFQTQMKQAGAQQINLPSGYRWNPDGSMAPITGGPADPKAQPPKPPTEGDKKNAVLFSSMVNAEQQIKDLEKKGGADTSSVRNRALGASDFTKLLQSEDYKKYEAAALRWSANLLYLKSGATATPEEVESTRKQFFPQPGDGPDVKAQKEQARLQEIDAVRKNMAPGAQPSNAAPSGWTIQSTQPTNGRPGAPQVGAIEDGYRFKGGDPSNQANWERVR